MYLHSAWLSSHTRWHQTDNMCSIRRHSSPVAAYITLWGEMSSAVSCVSVACSSRSLCSTFCLSCVSSSQRRSCWVFSSDNVDSLQCTHRQVYTTVHITGVHTSRLDRPSLWIILCNVCCSPTVTAMSNDLQQRHLYQVRQSPVLYWQDWITRSTTIQCNALLWCCKLIVLWRCITRLFHTQHLFKLHIFWSVHSQENY